MTALQTYLYRQILIPLFAILSALLVIAILTQGLNQLDVIVDQRESGLVFLKVTLLAAPQILALVLPFALFFAVIYGMNRVRQDSELVVAYASGISPWQLVSPILRLATVAALAHLAVNCLVQPAAFREMRATLHEMRDDFAASLVREGSFTTPADGLTIYARHNAPGGVMRDVLIHDSRNPQKTVTYTAKRGEIGAVEGQPAFIMLDGQVQQAKPDGALELINFDRYVLLLGAFSDDADELLLKSSDRYLHDLFWPDMTHFFDQRNAKAFLAEAHNRLSSPLLDLALALVALSALLTGEFGRRSYATQITQCVCWALFLRLAALGISAAAAKNPSLNVMQYALPIAAGGISLSIIMRSRPVPRGLAPAPPALLPAPA